MAKLDFTSKEAISMTEESLKVTWDTSCLSYLQHCIRNAAEVGQREVYAEFPKGLRDSIETFLTERGFQVIRRKGILGVEVETTIKW